MQYIDLEQKKNAIFFEQGYFSAIIAKWKDTINETNIQLNEICVNLSIKKEYLQFYKLVLPISNEMIDSFINSTFTFNSTVAYCQFMNKYGEIYFPPSSKFHYWHYVPNFDNESLFKMQDVIGLGCFQIQQSNSGYKDGQYKSITTSRPLSYCQSNEPCLTFVQILLSEDKITQITLAYQTSAQTQQQSEIQGTLQILTYLMMFILI